MTRATALPRVDVTARELYRREVARKIWQVSSLTTIALFGAGVGLSLSIVFLAPGVALMALSAVVGLLGLAGSQAVIRLL